VREPDGRYNPRGCAAEARRLWRSEEARARWLAALTPARTCATVALCISALRAHCARFQPVQVTEKRRREEGLVLTDSFYHTGAFTSNTWAKRMARGLDSGYARLSKRPRAK